MSIDVLMRAGIFFIFNNHGPAEVMPVASFLIACWTVLAFAYELVKPEPYPLFFGVPARQASWDRKPLPRKWIGVLFAIAGWMLWRLLYP